MLHRPRATTCLEILFPQSISTSPQSSIIVLTMQAILKTNNGNTPADITGGFIIKLNTQLERPADSAPKQRALRALFLLLLSSSMIKQPTRDYLVMVECTRLKLVTSSLPAKRSNQLS